MANTPSGHDAHFDAPLANVAIKAFDGAAGFIAQQVMPIVIVAKQSDKYYTIAKGSWLRVNASYRSRKAPPRRVEFRVSSDSYFADNYALAGENALEDLTNADAAIRLREGTTEMVTEMVLRDYENRVASICTSGTQLGSYVSLSGTAKWSDKVNSDPIADVTTAHAFIRKNTGLTANRMIIDADTLAVVKQHPLLLDRYKYTDGGMISDQQLAALFNVEQLLVPSGIKENAVIGGTSSVTNIWGNNVILARVQPGMSLKTATFGLTFRWVPAGIPGPVQAFRYMDPDPGKKVEVVEVGVYQDEKVVAKQLSYGILAPI